MVVFLSAQVDGNFEITLQLALYSRGLSTEHGNITLKAVLIQRIFISHILRFILFQTRVLVTHQLQFLQNADKIIILKEVSKILQ